MVTRRRVLGSGVTAFTAVAGTGAALGPMLAAGRGETGRAAGPPGKAGADGSPEPLFDETYRGRHLQGFAAGDSAAPLILIDGRPLRVMRRVDGTWISLANHYQPYPTPLATARGAVDAIGPAQLAAAPAHLHEGH